MCVVVLVNVVCCGLAMFTRGVALVVILKTYPIRHDVETPPRFEYASRFRKDCAHPSSEATSSGPFKLENNIKIITPMINDSQRSIFKFLTCK